MLDIFLPRKVFETSQYRFHKFSDAAWFFLMNIVVREEIYLLDQIA